MIDIIYAFGLGLLAASWWTSIAWPVIWTLLKIVVVVLPLMGAVAYLTLWERKFLGWMQVRLGPNRVGPWGLSVERARTMSEGSFVATKASGSSTETM